MKQKTISYEQAAMHLGKTIATMIMSVVKSNPTKRNLITISFNDKNETKMIIDCNLKLVRIGG